MPRLNWNFAPGRRLNWPWIGVCVIALLACVHSVLWRDHLLENRDVAIAKMHALTRQLAQANRPVLHAVPAPLKQVFSEMHAPWTAMLDSLQRVTHPGVELIALEPESQSIGRIRITGVANQTQDVFDLVEALHKDHSWSSVQLVGQASTERGTEAGTTNTGIPTLAGLSSSGVSFSLVAEWKPS